MAQRSSKIKKGLLAAIIISAALGLFSVISWIGTDYALHATSDQEFCGSCHSMKPVQASFLEDIHGGASTKGVQALCSDCHLPQDNYISYLYVKAKAVHGMSGKNLFWVPKMSTGMPKGSERMSLFMTPAV